MKISLLDHLKVFSSIHEMNVIIANSMKSWTQTISLWKCKHKFITNHKKAKQTEKSGKIYLLHLYYMFFQCIPPKQKWVSEIWIFLFFWLLNRFIEHFQIDEVMRMKKKRKKIKMLFFRPITVFLLWVSTSPSTSRKKEFIWFKWWRCYWKWE